ncbi:MAG: exodeoxyribonuclease III [Rhodospirillaceae bacterium]|jgi:exodeoxyribonuclease-3|nr:exodeoxyribonuclease III [Rhodospirillaceae bacterium]MBT5297089.1 exodeoxyribonuclease III [Rhodospirillaceae bacterium]MBT5515997.1 exodeoxyribonuclease III [Rhodospirillaceae bacterium]MBT6084505.1 exodeoxyribonuclease III [Rhodospirillaceae bacterium]MBT6609293.1 exodeoxyribonuclease III [Rhodospirillaceae bacterium]
MKIATWNVNSIKARLPRVVEWLGEFQPDVALLQELKCIDEAFPRMEIEDCGYNVATSGQKTYNGVAILSKHPIDVELTELPGDPSDEQARYIEALIGDVRVASIYLPNGNPTRNEDGTDHDKFIYKLGWMDRLYDHVKSLLATEDAFVLGGDYNIARNDDDVYDPARLADDAICRPEGRSCFRAISNLGLTDAYRTFNTEPHRYSYWDYQAGAWQKDNGVLIDHLLMSPQAADRLIASDIDKTPRGKEKASDHTPVWCEISG